MMRQSEFKRKYHPDTGKYTNNKSMGKELWIKSFDNKLRRKTTDKKVSFNPPSPPPKTSKKAGDKVVKILSKSNVSVPKKTRKDLDQQILKIMNGRGKKII